MGSNRCGAGDAGPPVARRPVTVHSILMRQPSSYKREIIAAYPEASRRILSKLCEAWSD
jgi:hypothetical protein